MGNDQVNPNAGEMAEIHPRPGRLVGVHGRGNELLAALRQRTPLGWGLRYGLAIGAVAAAMGLRQALTAWIGPGLPAYITFYPVVMAVALLAGFGPGLTATALASLAAAYWILQPAGFAVSGPADRLGLVVFTGMGLFMSGVAELYRRYRHKAAAYDRDAALRESQARLAAFAEATFEGINESEAGRIVDCNEQYARMLDYSVAELKGLEIASLLAAEDRDRVMANIQQGRDSSSEYTMLRKDGTPIVVEAHGRPISPGSARRHSAVRDITARKRAEEGLRHREMLLRAITDNSPDPIFLKDRDCRMLLANPATLAALHKRAEEVLGKADDEFYDDPAIGRRMMDNDRRVMETGRTEVIEEVVPGPSGPRTFLSAKTPYRDVEGRIIGVIGIARDITERKWGEAALRESRERLDLALASSRMATFNWDIVQNTRTWSQGVHSLLGTQPETFAGTAEEFFQVIHPEDRAAVQAALARAVETNAAYETEYRAVWADSSIHHISARGKVHRDTAGRAVQMTGVCWDITERKQAQEALRESEMRYHTLFNRIDAGFCIIEVLFDTQGKPTDYRFLEVNEAFAKQTGLPDAQGKRIRELAPALEAHWFEIFGKIASTGEAKHFVNEAKALGRWYDVYAYRIGAPESRQVAILFNDITAHKQAETKLRAANQELTRFNDAMVGRELRMIELKKEINTLCAQQGQPPRYSPPCAARMPPSPRPKSFAGAAASEDGAEVQDTGLLTGSPSRDSSGEDRTRSCR
jgi:PAS domain S-box-containing protein